MGFYLKLLSKSKSKVQRDFAIKSWKKTNPQQWESLMEIGRQATNAMNQMEELKKWAKKKRNTDDFWAKVKAGAQNAKSKE